MNKHLICIGQINKPHGLKGSLKVTLSLPSSLSEHELTDKKLFIQGYEESFVLKKISEMNKFWIVDIEHIDTVEKAEEYRNREIYIEKSEIGELPDNEFLVSDLIGLKVFDSQSKEEIGELVSVEIIPQNDLLKIKTTDDKDFLIPMVGKYVNIDMQDKSIYLTDWKEFAEVNL